MRTSLILKMNIINPVIAFKLSASDLPYIKKIHVLIMCCLFFLMTSCTITSSKNEDYINNGVSPIKPPPLSWQISAKLGISSTHKNGSVTLNWQQIGEEFVIQVQGPLGQGSAVISGTQYNVEIKQPGQQTLQSNNVDELVLETFGWTLPFDSFIHWVVATANPQQTITHISYDPTQNTLSNLEQSDWQIEYSRYKLVESWALPGRIKARHIASKSPAMNSTRSNPSDTDDAQTTLTLIIREWTIL